MLYEVITCENEKHGQLLGVYYAVAVIVIFSVVYVIICHCKHLLEEIIALAVVVILTAGEIEAGVLHI